MKNRTDGNARGWRTEAEEKLLKEIEEVCVRIRKLEGRRDKLVRRQTRQSYGRLVNYYLRSMYELVGEREEFEAMQVHGAHNFAKSFLSYLETVRGYLVRTGQWPVAEDAGDEAAAAQAEADPEALRREQEAFREDWPKNTLKAVQFHVADLAKLVSKSGELPDEHLAELYRQIRTFVSVFGMESDWLAAAGRQAGEVK